MSSLAAWKACVAAGATAPRHVQLDAEYGAFALYERRNDDDTATYERVATLRGITSLLRAVCYDNYDAERVAKQAQKRKRELGVKASDSNGGRRLYSLAHAKAVARRRGALVHEQVERVVREGPAWYHREYAAGRLHAYTRRIFEIVERRAWTPLHAEYVVYDAEAGLASAVDLVCYDTAHDTLVFLELKTGGEHHLRYHTGSMRGVPSHPPPNNSLLSQAKLQLSVYRHMLYAMHPALRAARAHYYVLFVGDSGAMLAAANDFVTDAAVADVYAALVACKNLKRDASQRTADGREATEQNTSQ